MLYAFGFYNQVKSLAPTLKILLVFLYEDTVNQLQQSKGYWDSCIIGQSRTGSRALNGEIVATLQVQLGIEVWVRL